MNNDNEFIVVPESVGFPVDTHEMVCEIFTPQAVRTLRIPSSERSPDNANSKCETPNLGTNRS